VKACVAPAPACQPASITKVRVQSVLKATRNRYKVLIASRRTNDSNYNWRPRLRRSLSEWYEKKRKPRVIGSFDTWEIRDSQCN
jgi:hypothetical protein